MTREETAAALAGFGFKLEQTGGDCTAYVRDSDEVCEIITLANAATAPEDLNDAVAVGAYSNTDAADYRIENGYTLADVLAALRNPSDEYSLLTLRLFNGLHK